MDSRDVNAAKILLTLMKSTNNRSQNSEYSTGFSTECSFTDHNCDSNNTNSYNLSPVHADSIEYNMIGRDEINMFRKRQCQDDEYDHSNEIDRNSYLDTYEYLHSDWQPMINERQNKFKLIHSQILNQSSSNSLRNKQTKSNSTNNYQQVHCRFDYPQVDRAINKPINYSDVEDSSNNVEESNFSESDFDFYYSEQNLYRSENEKYFDNKTKYRIFVVRYDDDIRVFKPRCIVRKTGTLLCSIIGTYCVDCNDLSSELELPADFIWPISANRHDDNVRTIRKLIQDNPVDEKLPYVDENNDIRPYSLSKMNSKVNNENCPDRMDLKKLNHSDSKISNRKNNSFNTGKKLNCSTDDRRTKSNNKSKLKKRKHLRNVKPAHCPYCFQRFSATSAAKMHYNGRPTNSNERGHVSCKVASTIDEDEIDKHLEPILCCGNCKICSQI